MAPEAGDPTPPPWFPPLAPLPTGAGTLFRVVSGSASRMALQLYADAGATRPARTLRLDPARHRKGDVWEILVPGVGPGQTYTWAVDPARPLIDPCALAVTGPERFGSDGPPRTLPPLRQRNRSAEFKSVVVAPPEPAARLDAPRPWKDSVIYELHVRGFSRHPSSGVAAQGTYAGLADCAPRLRELGITAVELLPVHEFDETEVRRAPGLFNFWGYSPIAWFAPNRRFARDAARFDGPLAEFRSMVEAFHREGIEVILDVVFNHTGELDARGPTWNLRDLDGEVYYLRDADGGLVNLTGCGNTVRAQHPTARSLILQALRWWVHALGVDGFRFDLAAILARDEEGEFAPDPPLVREIEEDPLLRGTRLVAEAWDAAGGYRVADWPGGARWSVWNDRFRDDVRGAWLHGDGERAPALARRLTGSSDLFPAGPLRGVNYVTAHDGMTLADCVAYARRHNEANGEQGRDGHEHEVCANHGVEGASDDPEVRARRDRARRNLAASLLLAHGVPMLLAGDELGRTQRGNNNAYCHDSELTWVDWSGRERDADFFRFVRGLVRLRRECAALRRTTFLQGGAAGDVAWLGPDGNEVDWEHAPGAFGYLLSGRGEHTGAAEDGPGLLVLVNLHAEPATFARPSPGAWLRVVDTAAVAPGDYHDPETAPPLEGDEITLAPRSLVILRTPANGR